MTCVTEDTILPTRTRKFYIVRGYEEVIVITETVTLPNGDEIVVDTSDNWED